MREGRGRGLRRGREKEEEGEREKEGGGRGGERKIEREGKSEKYTRIVSMCSPFVDGEAGRREGE